MAKRPPQSESDWGMMARLEIHLDQRLPHECWPWTGKIGKQGYGQLWVRTGAGGSQLAHRVAHMVYVGPIPEGYSVHHTCRNRACCNPAHLQALDRADHTREHFPQQKMCAKGLHELTEDNRASDRSCLACAQERDRERAREARRTGAYARATAKRMADPEYADKMRAYKREWARRKRERDRVAS